MSCRDRGLALKADAVDAAAAVEHNPGVDDDAGRDTGVGVVSSANAGQPSDAAVTAMVMGCTSFIDRTSPDASRDLTWDFTFPTTAERCLLVRAGQTIRFSDGAGHPAKFELHSVQPSEGDTPNPLESSLDLTTGIATIPRPGTFGFYCVDHRTMRGAVRAIE